MEDAEDEFLGSIFSFDGVQHSEPQSAGLLTPSVKVPGTIEDVDFEMAKDTGAAASILSYVNYERHFKVSTTASRQFVSRIRRKAAGHCRTDSS